MTLHEEIRPPLSPHDSQVVGVGEAALGCSSLDLRIQVGVLQGVGVRSGVEVHSEVFHSEVFHSEVFHSEGVGYDGDVVALVEVWWEVVLVDAGSVLRILRRLVD